MKFWEAMRELEAGKKVRRKDWQPEEHIFWPCWCPQSLPVACYGDISAEWELYQEPPRTYSFTEIVPLLKEGRKFSRPSLGSHSLKGGHMYVMINSVHPDIGEFSAWWQPMIKDLEATDWFEVKE